MPEAGVDSQNGGNITKYSNYTHLLILPRPRPDHEHRPGVGSHRFIELRPIDVIVEVDDCSNVVTRPAHYFRHPVIREDDEIHAFRQCSVRPSEGLGSQTILDDLKFGIDEVED